MNSWENITGQETWFTRIKLIVAIRKLWQKDEPNLGDWENHLSQTSLRWDSNRKEIGSHFPHILGYKL